MNLEQLNQSHRLDPDERWNATAARRAEAMSHYSDQAKGERSAPQSMAELDWYLRGKRDNKADLHRPAPQPMSEYDRSAHVQDRPRRAHTDRAEWLQAVDIVIKHWRLSVMFAAALVSTVTLYTLMMKPTFEPQARVEVDPPGAEVFSLEGNKNSGAAADYMETQAQNLQNDELALEVIRQLHLEQSPYFGGDSKAIKGSQGVATDFAVPLTPAENKALYVFKQSRKVSRDAASRLITVSVGAPDPVVAATVTNTLVSMFIERDYTLRNDAISQSSKWLQRQLDDIRQRMDESNHALNRFQATHGIGMIGDNQNRFSDQMIELTRQLIQAQADRIQLQSYLGRINGDQVGSLPQINGNPVVQELTKRLAEVKADLAQNRAIYGGNHPNTKKLQNQADALDSELASARAHLLLDLKTSYTAAQTREHLTESQVQGASRQMAVLAQYNALKKEADANTELYQALYQKIKEAAIAAETKSSNVRVVDRARVLDRPTRPHRSRNIGIGILVGLIGGVLIAFLREGLDTRIHTAEDVKRCLETESVSTVPVIGNGQAALPGHLGQPQPSKTILENTSLFQITRPTSPEGEALRSLGVSVRLSRHNSRAPQILLVVSPLTGEGKTTLTVNLALTLAQHGITCIVDADLRGGRVASAVGVHAQYGIREVLANSMDLDRAILPAEEIPQLSILAPGSAPGEPGELLSSSAMSDMIEQLRGRFDFVVIDSPPMLLFSDGRALSTFADGVIVVGRSGITTRANLKRTMELLSEVRSAPVIQVVLNAAEYSAIDSRYYSAYSAASRTTAAGEAKGIS